jgi:hypothetical protein
MGEPKFEKITDIEYKYTYDFRKTNDNYKFLRNFLLHAEYDNVYEITSKSEIYDCDFLEKIYRKGVCTSKWVKKHGLSYHDLDYYMG